MSESTSEQIERISAWQCIGCGKVEAPRECIGVCKDRKVEFVHSVEYDQAVMELEQMSEFARSLVQLARQLAWSTPRAGEWEQSYRALQRQARLVLRQEADVMQQSMRQASGS